MFENFKAGIKGVKQEHVALLAVMLVMPGLAMAGGGGIDFSGLCAILNAFSGKVLFVMFAFAMLAGAALWFFGSEMNDVLKNVFKIAIVAVLAGPAVKGMASIMGLTTQC